MATHANAQVDVKLAPTAARRVAALRAARLKRPSARIAHAHQASVKVPARSAVRRAGAPLVCQLSARLTAAANAVKAAFQAATAALRMVAVELSQLEVGDIKLDS